jgi:hypothetical protein
MRKLVGSIAIVVAAGGLITTLVGASDIELGATQFGTDVVYAGVGGVRGSGVDSEATLTVAGASSDITQALLYWHGPTNSADPASNAAIAFDGTDITGTNIGTSDNNCWGFQNSQAYRADVTDLVTGDGAYVVSKFIKIVADNSIEINGFELVVFFDDGDDTNDRDVVLFEGNDSNQSNAFDANGWNVSLDNINYDSGAAGIQMIVADGQSYPDGSLQLNAQTLDAGPNLFQGDTVPDDGTSASHNGTLWDSKRYDITSFLTAGDNDLELTHTYTNDCLSLIVAAIDLPAGAAPGQPTTTTTPTTPTTAPAAPPAVAVDETPRFTG